MNLTSALSNGFKGLFDSGHRHHQAGQEILQSTVDNINLNYGTSSVQDRVSISSVTENISDSPNLERGVINLSSAGVTYNASAKLVSATNSLFNTLFSEVA